MVAQPGMDLGGVRVNVEADVARTDQSDDVPRVVVDLDLILLQKPDRGERLGMIPMSTILPVSDQDALVKNRAGCRRKFSELLAEPAGGSLADGSRA